MDRILLLTLALAWPAPAMTQADTPVGLWTTLSDATGKPEGLVRIEEMDGEFLGTVVRVLDAETPNPRCERCEGDLKDKPVVGMTILRGLRRSAGSYEGGTILDPDNGRSYRCTVTLLYGGRRLEIRGYAFLPLFGRKQIWVRAE